MSTIAQTQPQRKIDPKEYAQCGSCSQTEQLDAPVLLRCSKCKITRYCSVDCQRSHWRMGLANSSGPRPFHDYPESFTFLFMIDTYRLVLEHVLMWDNRREALYAGDDPLPNFKKFLEILERDNKLPEWWSTEKRKQLEDMAMTDRWANINKHVTEEMVIAHYKDSLMPMKMSLAGSIYMKELRGDVNEEPNDN